MVNADQPYWLLGMTEMTRTFGLELLETVLTSFTPVFFKVLITTSVKSHIYLRILFLESRIFIFTKRTRLCFGYKTIFSKY